MVPPPATLQPQSKAAAFKALLASRDFVLLWWGQLISSVGDRFTFTALIMFVFAGESVGKYAAQFAFAGMLPGLLFAPLYGWVIDSFERKRIMIAADLIRVGVVLSFIFVLSEEKPDYTLACISLFMLGSLNGLFIPARQASLPQIVPADKLLAANGLIALLGPFGTLVGTPLAFLLISLLGTWDAYLINALGFIISALCIKAISIELWPDKQKQSDGHQPLKKTWGEIWDGWKTLRSHPSLMPLVFINGLFAFASLMFMIVVLEHVKKNLDVQPVVNLIAPFVSYFGLAPWKHETFQAIAVGLLMMGVGSGMGLGVYFCGRAKQLVHWNGLPYVGLITLGVGFCLFANLRDLIIIVPYAVLLGAAATAVPVPIEARIQNDVDNHHRGRLFALRNMWTTTCSLVALGMNIDGSLLQNYGASTMITALGAAMISAAILLYLRNLSALRTFWSVRRLQQ